MSATGGYRLGFTGTRKGMTEAQKAEFRWIATLSRVQEFHHGACVGADTDADQIVQEAGIPRHVHPGISKDGSMPTFRAPLPGATFYDTAPYITRDHIIVDSTDRLVACPAGREILRSGTWATVRYAVKAGKPVYIIYPDGGVEFR